MNFDEFFQALYDFAHQDWVTRILVGVIIVLVTLAVARISAYALRNILSRGKGPIPQNSIFINIIRLCIWIIGISILLGVCFNINLSAILTALGVGGIAVSLGFQATLSNLIGGLEVSISRIFVPGDNVQIGNLNLRGIVKDVTWRHTTIIDYSGNEIVVPNSLMNTQSLVVLLPRNHISIPLSIARPAPSLDKVAQEIEQAAHDAVSPLCSFEKDPLVQFSEVTEGGIKGTLSFIVDKDAPIADVADAAVRAAADYTNPQLVECVEPLSAVELKK